MDVNRKATIALQRAVSRHSLLRGLPYYLGLVPYEVYVIPGMYVAMLQMVWSASGNAARFHILPHLFAFSLFQMLKGAVGRTRPGCAYREMRRAINPSHCKGRVRHESFPSGHTGIAFALAAALYLELFATRSPALFDVPVPEPMRAPIAAAAVFVATMVSLHRVAGGYHHVGDVCVGAVLGALVGVMTWSVLSKLDTGPVLREQSLPLWGKVALTIPITFLMLRFLSVDLFRLTSIRH